MIQATARRKFEPGTTGWTVDDLSDPGVQSRWSKGRYELVDGVLTKIPPQGLQGIKPLHRLRRVIERHAETTEPGGEIYTEVDVLLRRGRMPRPDMIFLTRNQLERQAEIEAQRNLAHDEYRPVFVAPYLVVESISKGHEDHDRVTKREWYAEAEVPHYWLLNASEDALSCLVLEGDGYVEESSGRAEAVIHTRAFKGLEIPLVGLWRKP
jgi:Uma2 family endonuclease